MNITIENTRSFILALFTLLISLALLVIISMRGIPEGVFSLD